MVKQLRLNAFLIFFVSEQFLVLQFCEELTKCLGVAPAAAVAVMAYITRLILHCKGTLSG